MENDNLILTETEKDYDEAIENDEYVEEKSSFEISDEAREQSRKFFKFGSKKKKDNRKFESFEIVKTYTPKEKVKKDNEFDKILEVSNNLQTSEETISVKNKETTQKVQYKVRPQGKLILAVISIIIILISSLCIYNAFEINRLNSDINNLNNEITVQDFNIDKAIKNLQNLNDDAKSNEQALKLELEKATDTYDVTLYERQDTPQVKEVSNWFDKLCNMLSKIFGG